MAFIGTPLDTRNTFQSLAGKRFNGDGSTTAFTLDVAPSSTLDIEVFVGNVRQDPNSAYTLSGTTLTFTGAPPSGTNNIYVVHQAKSVGTIDVPSSYKSEAQTISGARTFNGGITMGGTTPTLTIGDAGAEDAKIVFDGNAQDYHIGLDDSADDLVIGKGSALGTTANIVIDENGHVTKPLNTYVYAYMNADQVCDADDSDKTLQLNAELKDLNADFNVSNYTFTAPVDGAYLCTGFIQIIENTAANVTDWFFGFKASNGNEYGFGGNPSPLETGSGSNYTKTIAFSKIIFMDANDTMVLFADAYSGGSYTFKVDGHSNSYQATSMQINLLG